jgi:hypothetical protein
MRSRNCVAKKVGSDVIAHDPKSDDLDEYVMWGFSSRREALASPTDLEELSGEELKDAVLVMMDDWHPALRRMVETDLGSRRLRAGNGLLWIQGRSHISQRDGTPSF